jgi:hypothetical protein
LNANFRQCGKKGVTQRKRRKGRPEFKLGGFFVGWFDDNCEPLVRFDLVVHFSSKQDALG